MAAIGSVGKIDTNDISKMVVGASSPVRSTDQAQGIESALPPTRISSAGKLQQALSQLSDAARRLSQPETWQATKASSSAPEVLDATTQQAEADQKIDVQVDQVAMAQTTAAPLYSPLATPIGLGTLNIELGSWDTSVSSFTANPNWPKAKLSTGPGDVSVQRLRDKINAAGIGVIANVISDPTGSYLILRAASSGRDNGFRITAEASPEATQAEVQSLKALEFDPANNPAGMQLTQAAQDATLRVNGQAITSSSNFIEDLVPGVDATAKRPSTEPVSIAIRPDRQVAKSSIEDFVRAYNDIQSQVSDAQHVDSPAMVAAAAAQKTVAAIWAGQAENDSLRQSLEKLGLGLNDHQQLTLDTRALDKSLRNQVSMPPQLDQMASALAPESSDSATAAPPLKAPNSQSVPNAPSSTSALFRQAVLEQYTNNMYAEDTH